MKPEASLLWAPHAWVDGRWQDAVLLQAGSDGQWLSIEAELPPPATATILPGPALPGIANAHSHAFQRAFAGLAERRQGEHDDFWSWRDRMYGVALRITPDELHHVARGLYRELLAGGYTQVCEFHYLHHALDGQRYERPAEMAMALVRAATDAGIGLTLLPVLYERAGFTATSLRDDQRRFASDADFVVDLRNAARHAGAQAGVAIHSLRAASPASMQRLLKMVEGDPAPIHIHIAEQTGEVDDCFAATGQRPIEWLCQHLPLDARWQLVHATHATPAEIEAVAASGAGVVICPSTEANLGDGICDLPRWLAAGVPISIGSDSHVSRSVASELRLLELSQRLQLRRRNVAADPAHHGGSTAAALLQGCIAGGAAAAGLQLGGLQAGARADLIVLDAQAPGLHGVATEHTLDAWVFATDTPSVAQVWVAGRRVA
jgi:formimidoylglutamate deiminase